MDVVAHLGIKTAVPKTILLMMSVDGLTRENVASHLQKYRLYLKRMPNGAGFPSSDPATDHLLSRLIFLHPGQDHCMPFVAPPQHGSGRPI
ncbi:hypothetical protein QQ045_004519 [Rhodiola kirilowii]